MPDVLWEDPSVAASSPRGPAFKGRLIPLMKKPGKWALVAEYESSNVAYTVASQLRNDGRRTPPGRWEFRSGKRDKAFAVWARYLGPIKNEPTVSAVG